MSNESGGSSGTSSGAIEAGKAYVAIGADDNLLVAGLKKAGNTITDWAKGVGSKFANVTSYFTDAFSTLFAGMEKSIERSAGIAQIADRLNASTEAVSTLGYALELMGKSVDSLEPAFRQLRKAIIEATKDPASDAALAFRKMAVSASEFAKMDIDEQIMVASDAYLSLTDNVQRAAFAQTLFGKSSGEVIGLLKAGPQALQEMANEAKLLGRVVSEESAENAVQARRNMIAVKYAWESIFKAFSKPLVKLVAESEDLGAIIIFLARTFNDWLSQLSPVTTGIFVVGAAITGLMTAAGLMVTVISTGFTALVGVVTAATGIISTAITVMYGVISSPIVILTVAIAALGAAFIASSDSAMEGFSDFGASVGRIASNVGSSFVAMGETVGTAIKGIAAAIRQGDMESASKIAIAGLQLLWLQFKDMIFSIWDDMVIEWGNTLNRLGNMFKAKIREMIEILARTQVEMMKFARFGPFGKAMSAEEADITTAIATQAMLDEITKRTGKFEAGDIVDVGAAKARKEARKTEISETAKNFKDMVNTVIEKGKKDELGKGGASDRIVTMAVADAVKGAFTSGDWAGRLAVGPASNYAKEAVKTQKSILSEVQQIRQRMRNEEFK